MRKWTWLVPCWIWRWWMRTGGRQLLAVYVDDTYTKIEWVECVRIDQEYLLVRFPTRDVGARWQNTQTVQKLGDPG